MTAPGDPGLGRGRDGGHKLRRALTTPMLTLYGLGVTIGAGIYVLVGEAASVAGQYAATSFMVAALVVAFTALSYAELSVRLPVSAGEAAYVEVGLGSKWFATLVGLTVAASGVVSAAAISIGAAGYLYDFFAVSERFWILAVVAAMGAIALWGIAQSVTVAAVITVIEVLGLLVVVVWGLFMANPAGVPLEDTVPDFDPAHWKGVAAASLLAFFAFVGFEDMANVAEEVQRPAYTMPRAIFWTLLIATLLYVATTSAVIVAVPLTELASSSAPLALVFQDAPQSLRNAFGFVAIVATVNGVLIQIIMASRVVYGLADRGHLPSVLARVSKRTHVPALATFLIVGLVAIFGLSLPIAALAEHTSQLVLAVFISVNLALIWMKRRGELGRGAFQVPFIVPVLGMITSTGLLATSFL